MATRRPLTLRSIVRDYFWVVGKNVVGWLLIAASPVLGVTLPGPGGIPVFLIGFALVSFPGKRRLTARALRQRPVDLSDPLFVGMTTFFAVVVTVGLTIYGAFVFDRVAERLAGWGVRREVIGPAVIALVILLALIVSWLTIWAGLHLANWALKYLPWARRKSRSGLRTLGFRFLPPRRGAGGAVGDREPEILELSPGARARLTRVWRVAGPWLARMVVLGAALALLSLIFVPIVREPSETWAILRAVSPAVVAGSLVVLVAHQLTLRPLLWRGVLRHTSRRSVPARAAVRVWARSEAGSYLPLEALPLLTRAYGLRPLRVSAASVTDARHLETALTVGGGLAGAGGLLLWAALIGDAGYRPSPGVLVAAAVLLVTLPAVVLWPSRLRAGTDLIARWLETRPMQSALTPTRTYTLALAAAAGGLLWAAAAAAVTLEVLRVPPGQLPGAAAAYLLAWAAGAAVRVVPAGLGVRELVFYVLLRGLLPEDAARYADPATRDAAFALAAVALRVWSVAGTLLAAGIASLLPAPRQ